MTTSSTTTAVIYCRISRDREGAGLGVDRQAQDCRELAARLGLTVVETYIDNDMSAYSGKPRPAYRQLLDDLKSTPRTVLCWHTDRLHRSPRELEEWISVAEPRAITVQTVKAGELDLATPSGRMNARIVGAVARHESEHKAERIARKMQEKADAGAWLGGPVPFGWQRLGKGVLGLKTDEAALITRGTRMLLDGKPLRAVVRDWIKSGVPARHGEKVNDTWHRHSVSSILARWRNAAIHEHHGEPGGPAEWPAIPDVGAEDVRAVREMLAGRSDAFGIGNRSVHLLAGIALCATCGAPVRAASAQRGRGYRTVYRCSAAGKGHVGRNSDPIDEYVREVIAARLRRPDVADLLPVRADAVDVPGQRAEVAKLRARLDTLATMLADGDLDRVGYRTAAARVRERLEAAETALSASVRRSPLEPVLAHADPAAAFLAADVDSQRAIIRAMVTITIHRLVPGRRPFDPGSVEIAPRA